MTVRILTGDAREKLAELPDESVHCVVTSPPYFGLRDYGTASWVGGDPACDHAAVRRGHGDEKQSTSAGTSRDRIVGTDCRRCGASRADKQIGLEPTPAEFVAVLVEVFREVRRVLRRDGTLWLNLGDSYAAQGGGKEPGAYVDKRADGATWQAPRKPSTGLKPKDLIGIPWRVAFALQADGWYLRQDIIWAKPNPMPESVTDRCTKAHEYLFLLSRSPRYHYDAEAIREEPSGRTDPITSFGAPAERQDNGRSFALDALKGANRRSVWTVATQPFKEAHFATFPPDLIEPCIKAGCPRDCCAKCGAPVVREVISQQTQDNEVVLTERAVNGVPGLAAGTSHERVRRLSGNNYTHVRQSTGNWSPSCACNAGTVRGTVLDPFGGAGTTGLVADRLQRDAILIELNPEYAALSRARIEGDVGPLFGPRVIDGLDPPQGTLVLP
jgi:DNA modification methylase